MSVHTAATDQHQHTSRGPVARIVATGVATGLGVAALLVTVVFPGAPESTVTGSLLAAFGFGWALTGILGARFLDRPLGWTAVPAVSLGVTGAALLVCSPGDTELRGLAWVWPVPALALAAYVWTQSRRTLPRRGRWMTTPLAVVIAVAALGALYEDVTLVRDQHADPGPGALHDVGGHELYLDCRGHGSPTVVLSNGLGEVAASWTRILGQVDTRTRVCAYDRAGQGWSTDPAQPQDGVTAARDLHTLLRNAGEHGPFVLVGHSTGGTYAMTYAARYPHQVAGMALLDSSSPHQFTALPAYPGQYAVMRRGLALLPTLDRLGLGRAISEALPSHLPERAADVVTSLTASAHGARNGRDEVSMLPRVFAQAQALTTLDGRPLAVLTTTESLGTDGWGEAQDQLVGLSTHATHEVVYASHAGLVEDQVPAEESARAIDRVVHAVRTGRPLR